MFWFLIEISFSAIVTLLVGSGATGFVCVLCDIPVVQVTAFILLMCSGMAPSIVNAAIVDLYPTSMRWGLLEQCNMHTILIKIIEIDYFFWTPIYRNRATSVCIALMFGRLGSVIGSNVSAILLDYYCEAAFYSSGFTLIGISSHSRNYWTIWFFIALFALCVSKWTKITNVKLTNFFFAFSSVCCLDIFHTKYSGNTIKKSHSSITTI